MNETSTRRPTATLPPMKTMLPVSRELIENLRVFLRIKSSKRLRGAPSLPDVVVVERLYEDAALVIPLHDDDPAMLDDGLVRALGELADEAHGVPVLVADADLAELLVHLGRNDDADLPDELRA